MSALKCMDLDVQDCWRTISHKGILPFAKDKPIQTSLVSRVDPLRRPLRCKVPSYVDFRRCIL